MSGRLQEQVCCWFQALAAHPKPEESRKDWYLQLSNQSHLGIKLRQGRLDIKQRITNLGVQPFTASAAGQVETWQKWSFSLQNSPLAQLQQSEPRWIGVQKTRRIKVYGLDAKHAVVPLEPDTDVYCSCEVEIAQIYAFNQSWCSLGLEATGSNSEREQLLRQIAIALLSSADFSFLTPTNSHSYASWLVRLA